MPGFLKWIEMENFKSYRGSKRIGPMQPFTAVIGPNGSGKSNFMDAISFVMGEKTSSLRVKRLSDLIHGASINEPVSRSASVTAVFQMPSGAERRFTRLVLGSSSEHKIDSEVVTSQAYLSELEQMGINAKAKNFLVFQGAVESIAMKNPKERTALFEEISGSGALKEEYDRLKVEMLKAEEDTQFTYQKKKGIAAERKEAKLEKEEAEKYQRLKEELAQKYVESHLFKLFHNEKESERCSEDLRKKQKEVTKIETKRHEKEEDLQKLKKDHGKKQRDMAAIEQQIREKEVEINKRRPTFIKAKERVAHIQKKLDSAKKSLTQALKANAAHSEDIQVLEKELEEVDKRRQEYEDEIAGESSSQGRDVHLEDAQVREYNHLKEEASIRSAMILQELDGINREQKSDQDRMDNELRKKTDIDNRLRQKAHQLEEAEKRLEKLNEHIRTSEAALEEQVHLKEELQRDVGSSKDRVAKVQVELEAVMEQLGDARIDKHEEGRRKKKQEIVENLKRLFPGVYDRMINMCQPIHKRYNVAVTKILGKNMEAIVCDSEKTARACIQYLKEQMLDPETFLPLDYIIAKPLKERLREMKDPKNVRLLYDVLHYEPSEIKKAVLFATNNALVCETPEDAQKVAYCNDDGQRYDAVALDGTYYQKSGIISGGSVDLSRRAKRWEEKSVNILKQKKEKLTEELREAQKKSRKEMELKTVESQIKGLETRLKYSRTDRDNTPRIAAIQRTISSRDEKIVSLKQDKDNVEDELFSDFCAQIGVANIRQYEERELRSQQERAKRRLEFEDQKNRILNQLEFEKSRDTNNNVQRWERAVQDDEDELERCKEAEQKQMAKIEQDMKDVDSLRKERLAKKAEVDAVDEDINKIKREMSSIGKDLQAVQKQVTQLENRLEAKKAEKHSILRQCKLDAIAIPLSSGDLDNIEEMGGSSSGRPSGDGETTESSTLSSQAIYETEAQIQVDYSQLPSHLQELDDYDDVRKVGDKMNKEIHDLQTTLQKIQAPNLKATQKLDAAKEKLQETNEEFDTVRRRAKKAKQAFERVKKERYDKFIACFEHVSNEIDPIYKALAQNQSAQAFLGPENPEEPYLDGINYNCVAPGKRFQPMSNLSGGEKTVAALALLFAVHSYHPAPFFVLDEIDAALDNTNISKVARYIRDQTNALQFVVISLKEEFYSHSDALIGICPDPGDCTISRMITLDLRPYEHPGQQEEQNRSSASVVLRQ
ncbi:unnamed protein product [Darwinula stevensoni]|uniref:Structural maintenance of chromosomes protein n=1 Tax=Darwinula stevensoni TaxID=69355 RepID=A0A7R9AAT3_9CRUS|nr:unnamed protein product [Darwinula stevensoni]CAG0898742.1 unnamed protein product [Darwinula stevensoni]